MNSTKIITEDITTNFIDSICIPIQSLKTIDLEITDNFNKCLIYLDKTYNKNVWKYLNEGVLDDQSSIQTDYKSGIYLILECLYGKSTQNSINSNHLLNLKEYTPIETSSFNIIYDTSDLSNLHQLLLYSPHSIDNNNEKILFIFYQLLKLFKYFHSINLNCYDLKLNDIYIDKNYWIKIKPPIKSILNQYLSTNEIKETQEQLQHDNEDENNIIFYSIKENLKFKYDSFKHLNFKDLSNLTKQWCDNKISNFDYLLILNCLAGKQLDSPFNHPIFPWITDFQSFNTNLRDLSISKFRLNKGDTHLDMTYQAAKQLNTSPPYHITEFLSEITYFVYKSRQTDKQTLCQHVRSNWVPNEYPKSIDRLYIWTPEECIPEFYCDSNIFKSIHDDLPDLQVPNWCNGSIDEFIRTHRLLLESDLVSKKLHHWIDLVFGYKLTGDAAIESKNVCLQLVDNNNQSIMKPFGIVQLFTIQHPFRSIDKYYHCKQPPNIINRSRLKNDCLDDSSKKVKYASYTQTQLESAELLRKRSATTTITSSSSISTNYDLITNQQIQLPDDYTNPLLVCDQIETLLKFTNRTYHCSPDLQQKQQQKINANKTFQDFISLDMKCLACLLAEICFFNRLKCLPQENSLETRCSFINKMFIKEPHLLSGPYALFISSILKPYNNNNNTKNKSNKFIENLLKYQSNFINIDLMLNLNTTILPFKPYLEQFYKFSKRFHIINNLIQNYAQLNQLQIKQEINSLMKLKQQDQQIDQIELNEHLNQLSLSYLPLLMSELSDPKKTQLTQSYCSSYTDSFELLLPILEHLFSNPYTCIDSFLYFFTRMTRYVSKQIVYKKFLPILLHMLNVVDLNETIGLNIANTNEDDIKKHKFLKLFEFKFINELKIIFGLELFLTQIFPLIIEAISGFKDLDFTATTPPDLVDNNQNETIIANNQQKINDLGGIFDFETDLNKVIEEEEEGEEEEEQMDTEEDIQKGSSINDSQSLTDTSQNNNNNILNISIISFNTFTRIISTIGPVLTCKYCCRDLLKMLAICYMNMKCLNKMDESNPLNSVRPIEGDRFASLILESLKYVAVLFSDQVIVLQYLTHVSNSISSATNKLTIRLEASLLAGCVLVSYFLNYLDIKLLMDNLNYILYQILQPVILLYSNFETVKFPSGVLMRQCIAFKVLDIILLLSLRIGPEQTRIEMEFIIKAYFDAFSLVGNSKLVSSCKPSTAIKNSIQIKRQSIVAFNIDEYLKFSYDKSTNEIIGSSLGSKIGSSSDTTSDTSDQTTKYRTHSIGLLSLNIDEQQAGTPSINNNNLETNEELINTFTNELANIGYYSISRLNSGVYIDSILKNSDLIHQMCNQFDLEQKKQKKTYNYNIPSSMTMDYGKSPPIKSNYNKLSSSYSSSFSENVSVSGNQIQFQNQNELSINNNNNNNNSFVLKFNENELKENKFKIDTSRHLTDNWLAYWENEIRNNNNEIHSQFDFKHINLLTLSGHTSAVKCLLSLENESCLISGSKDKTVKLWSIKNQMGSANKKTPQSCQWTYKNHKKPVFSLIFIESQRLCASSDMSSVHVWDPFIGRKLIQLEINNNNNNNIGTSTNSQLNITSMASLQMPASSFILSTNDNLIKFIDLRINSFTHEFKTCHSSSSLSSNGTIKSISACDNNLLVFFSTGLICLLDIRTGWLIESFKNHDNELIQGKFYGQQQFVTTYNDGSIGFSLIKEKCHLKKLTKNYSEPVAFMSSTDQQLITSTSSNKIGIHSNINQSSSQITFTVDKLKTDYFKGFITSQTYLKLNRLLLIGSDYGDIRVLC